MFFAKRVQFLTGMMAILLFSLAVAACQPTTGPTQPTVASSMGGTGAGGQTFSADDVAHGVALAQIEGHLQTSWLLWQTGEYGLSVAHAQHPAAELLPRLSDELAAQNVKADLEAALSEYSTQAGEAGQAESVQAAHQAALDAVADAEQALVGDWTDDVAFQGAVIRDLLDAVAREYAESVADGQVEEIAEYQDALGFLAVAQSRYGAVQSAVETADSHAQQEIAEKLEALQKALPSAMPPDQVVEPGVVEEAVAEINAELAKTLGLQETAPRTTDEIVTAIREDIEQALVEYEEGNSDEAYDLAADAYLEGFEHLEADLMQQGERELMESMELQFKELRDNIRAGKPLAEIQNVATAINENLDKVETLLQ